MTTRAAPRRQLLVALYGRSLILAGVARRLARHSHLEVVQIDGPTAADALGLLVPDALIVDLAPVPIDAALALLRDRPELILVGLEAAGARLLVLSGDRARAISTRRLVALLEGGRDLEREDEPMTPALPDRGIRHSEFDHNQSHQQQPRRVRPPAAVSHDRIEDEPRARMSPGARRQHSGSRQEPVPVEVPDVVA